MSSESGAKSGGMLGRRSSLAFEQDTRAYRIENAASMGPLTADTSRITIASATPIVSTGNPLDFRSSHT